MRILLLPPRKNVYPSWPFVGAGMAVFGIMGGVLHMLPDRLRPPCGFHAVTGHPCPSCGTTRMGEMVCRGRLLEAFKIQPFMFLLLVLLALWVLSGAAARLAGRHLFLEFSPTEERLVWFGALLLFMANWAYLWIMGV